MSAVLLIVLAVAAYGAYRAWDIWMHPIGRCPRCGGSKRNFGSNSARWGKCSRCGGKGEVLRRGGRRDL